MEPDIQLRLRSEEQCLNSNQDHDHEQNQQLPPMDGGKDAWLFLAACFMIEALIWGKFQHLTQSGTSSRPNSCPGFSFAYGIFQDYYSTHEPFQGSSNIAIIGTCTMVIPLIYDRDQLLTTALGRQLPSCPC